MTGPRDTDWRHVHVPGGDRAAAAPYLPAATKLLGFVKQEAGRQQLPTYTLQRRADDGAVITAEIRGGIPRITIVPPPRGGGDDDTDVPEHFVIRMRDEDNPDGIDPDTPETMERLEREKWRTLFYSADVAGYEGFPYRKGTYRTQAGIPVFPEGVQHAGNVDWRNADGVRVSWYGPSTRYFYDPYVLPRSQYGKFVFMLGQPLLDVDAYIEASEDSPAFDARWVMGAALDGYDALLVVHALLPESVDTPTGTAGPGDMHVSQPWPPGAVALEVCRYALRRKEGEGAPFLEVIPNSRELLAGASIAGAWNPWFFNPDATRAVSHALPENVLTRPTIDFTALDVAPSPTSRVATLVIDPDTGASIGSATVSLAPNGTAALASDWTEDGTRVDLLAVRTVNDGGFDTRGLQLGDFLALTRHVHDFRQIDGRSGSTYDRRSLVWADLREGVLVLAHRQSYQRLNSTSPVQFRHIEVWQRGQLVDFWQQPMRDPNEGEYTGLRRLNGGYADDFDDAEANHARAVAYAPAVVLYEILDYSPQVANRRYWQGAHGLYLNLAYPAADYFGSYVDGRVPEGNPYLTIASWAALDADFNYVQRDVHGHASVTGCASYGGVTVYSGWQVNSGGYVADPHCVTFTAPFYPGFPKLGGTAARCLPVWLLGTLPRNAGAS